MSLAEQASTDPEYRLDMSSNHLLSLYIFVIWSEDFGKDWKRQNMN